MMDEGKSADKPADKERPPYFMRKVMWEGMAEKLPPFEAMKTIEEVKWWYEQQRNVIQMGTDLANEENFLRHTILEAKFQLGEKS